MSELESSGLLDKEPEQSVPSNPPTQGPNPSTSTPVDMHTPDDSTSPSTGISPAGQETAEASLAATIVSAVTDDQAEVPKQGEGGDALEQQTAGASGPAAASNEAAEQRVLGELEGAPTWHEVLMLHILMHACTRKDKKRKKQTREEHKWNVGQYCINSTSCTRASLHSCTPTADAQSLGYGLFLSKLYFAVIRAFQGRCFVQRKCSMTVFMDASWVIFVSHRWC